jgi:hypothetical protein
VVHIPTNTTIYIDVAGTKETHTIMQAELVGIDTVLTTFSTHDWICIFTDSLKRPPSHEATPYQSWYHKCKALPPPQALA